MQNKIVDNINTHAVREEIKILINKKAFKLLQQSRSFCNFFCIYIAVTLQLKGKKTEKIKDIVDIIRKRLKRRCKASTLKP